jgi:hypothetical protein
MSQESNNESNNEWAAVIYRGIESEILDYKAAQNWRDLNRREKAKFVRHCLAMANTKGGYLVVGVGEDSAGKPSLFTGLTDEQLKSFDPSDVGNFINHRVDPPIDFEVVRPTVDGKTYAIFVIKRFRQLPHVASGQVEDELQLGCFYVRTADATSRVAYRAAEIHDIVQRALRNQREVLGRMIRGLLYEKGVKPEPLADSLFAEEIRHAHGFIHRNAKGAFSGLVFELVSQPAEYDKRAFGLTELKEAVLSAHRHFTESPLLPVDDDNKTYFTNVSLRSLSLSPDVYFQAFRSGQIHFQSALSVVEDIPVATLLKLLGGSLFFLASYYNELGSDDDLISIKLWLRGVDGKRLTIPGRKRGESPYTCRIPEIQIMLKRSAADLYAGIYDHTARVFHDFCIRFNVPDSRINTLRSQVSEYLDHLA